MRNDLTEVVLVLDRSGSMADCKDQAEEGANGFIKSQQVTPGECRLTLVQFDNVYEVVHASVPIKEAGHYTLIPRGGTALLDAIGRAINETGDRLSKTPEDQRPGLVVFVIITDGQENASREFNRDKIKQMITTQQDVYKWQFTFLGANQDAFAEAASIGIARDSAASYEVTTSSAMFDGASKNVTRMRQSAAGGQSVRSSYTAEERKAMSGM